MIDGELVASAGGAHLGKAPESRPELVDVIANLELMPLPINKWKSSHTGQRQRDLAQKLFELIKTVAAFSVFNLVRFAILAKFVLIKGIQCAASFLCLP